MLAKKLSRLLLKFLNKGMPTRGCREKLKLIGGKKERKKNKLKRSKERKYNHYRHLMQNITVAKCLLE